MQLSKLLHQERIIFESILFALVKYCESNLSFASETFDVEFISDVFSAIVQWIPD